MRAAELLGTAGLIVADIELQGLAARFQAADAKVEEPADGAAAAKQLSQAAKAGQLVVRLYAGDPLLTGAAQDAMACAKAGVRFEIVPGIPEHTAVPAYAGIPLASDRTAELRVIHPADLGRVADAHPAAAV